MTDEINNMKFQELRAYARELKEKVDGQPNSAEPASEDIAALKAELAELRGLQADRAGWLITTENILYDGTTYGVKFDAGMAFIQANRKFPQHHVEPPKEGLKAMAKMSDADWQRTLERSRRSDAEVLVEKLTAGMRGYKATWFSGEQTKQLQQVMDARRNEFQAAREKAENAASKPLTMPGYAGV